MGWVCGVGGEATTYRSLSSSAPAACFLHTEALCMQRACVLATWLGAGVGVRGRGRGRGRS